MSQSILIFNPECSKCRGADEILREKNISFTPIYYLRGELTRELLESLPGLLNLPYEKMLRTKEELYEDLGLTGKNLSAAEWIELILKHPILLERPIFIHQGKAVIARPSELINSIL